MKRYLLNILIFFGIIAVVDQGVGFLGDYLQAHSKGGDTKRTNDFVMKDCHDVVILGSSRAHHHYDTPFLSDTLGLDVYNAGYDGNGVILADGLLELLLERYQPKLIVFDVEPAFDIYEYPNDNHHIRYISTLKPYFRHENIGSIIKDVSREEWYKVHSGLIRYNSKLASLAVGSIIGQDDETMGFSPLTGVFDKDIDNGNTVNENVIDSFKLLYVNKIILTAKVHDCPIIFVFSPKLGAQNSTIMQPVKDICEEHGVDVIDYYSCKVFQDRFYFKEPMHLNALGARSFSERIAKVISIELGV